MGRDDRNEGHGPGECPEHRWVMQGATVTPAGSQVDSVCARCGALLVETGDELTGRV